MHLVFYGHDVLDIRGLSPFASWTIVAGGVYGAALLVRDVLRVVRRFGRWLGLGGTP